MARDTFREPASAAVEYFNGQRKGSQDAGSAMFDTKPYKRPNLIKFTRALYEVGARYK